MPKPAGGKEWKKVRQMRQVQEGASAAKKTGEARGRGGGRGPRPKFGATFQGPPRHVRLLGAGPAG